MSISEKRRKQLFAALESENVINQAEENPEVTTAVTSGTVDDSEEPGNVDKENPVLEENPQDLDALESRFRLAMESDDDIEESIPEDVPQDVIDNAETLGNEEIEMINDTIAEQGSEFDQEVVSGGEDLDVSNESLFSAYMKPSSTDKYIKKAEKVKSVINSGNIDAGDIDLKKQNIKKLIAYFTRAGKPAEDVLKELKVETKNLKETAKTISDIKATFKDIAQLSGDDLEKYCEKLKPIVSKLESYRYLSSYQVASKDSKEAKGAKEAQTSKESDYDDERSARSVNKDKDRSIIHKLGTFVGLVLVWNAARTYFALLIPGFNFILFPILIYYHLKNLKDNKGSFWAGTSYSYDNRGNYREASNESEVGVYKGASLKSEMIAVTGAAIEVMQANKALGEEAISLKKSASKEGWGVIRNLMNVAGMLTKPAVNAVSFMNTLVAMAEIATNQKTKDSSKESEVQDNLEESDGSPKESDRAPVVPEDSPEGEKLDELEADDQPLQEAEDTTSAGGDEAKIDKVESPVESVTEEDIQEEQEAIESAFKKLDSDIKDFQMIRNIQVSLESSIANGGTRRDAAQNYFSQLDIISERQGIEFNVPGISIESFNGFSERMIATEWSNEAVGDFAKKVGNKIAEFIQRIKTMIANFFKKRKDVNKKYVDKAKEVVAKVKTQTFDSKEIQNKSLNAAIGIKGKANVDTLKTIANNTINVGDAIFTNALNGTQKLFELIKSNKGDSIDAKQFELITLPSSIAARGDDVYFTNVPLPNGTVIRQVIPQTLNLTNLITIAKSINSISIEFKEAEPGNEENVTVGSNKDVADVLSFVEKIEGVSNKAFKVSNDMLSLLEKEVKDFEANTQEGKKDIIPVLQAIVNKNTELANKYPTIVSKLVNGIINYANASMGVNTASENKEENKDNNEEKKEEANK